MLAITVTQCLPSALFAEPELALDFRDFLTRQYVHALLKLEPEAAIEVSIDLDEDGLAGLEVRVEDDEADGPTYQITQEVRELILLAHYEAIPRFRSRLSK